MGRDATLELRIATAHADRALKEVDDALKRLAVTGTTAVGRIEAAFGRMASGVRSVAGSVVKVGAAIAAIGGAALGAMLHRAISEAREASSAMLFLESATLKAGRSFEAAKAQARGLALASGGTTANAARTLAQATRLTTAAGGQGDPEALVRAITDAALAAGRSLEEIPDMLTQISTGQDEVFDKLLGVNPSSLYAQWAAAAGRTASSLTDVEKLQIRINAVLKAGEANAGAAERRLQTAAGMLDQISSLFDDMFVAIGSAILNNPAILETLDRVRDWMVAVTGDATQLHAITRSIGNVLADVAEVAVQTAAMISEGWQTAGAYIQFYAEGALSIAKLLEAAWTGAMGLIWAATASTFDFVLARLQDVAEAVGSVASAISDAMPAIATQLGINPAANAASVAQNASQTLDAVRNEVRKQADAAQQDFAEAATLFQQARSMADGAYENLRKNLDDISSSTKQWADDSLEAVARFREGLDTSAVAQAEAAAQSPTGAIDIAAQQAIMEDSAKRAKAATARVQQLDALRAKFTGAEAAKVETPEQLIRRAIEIGTVDAASARRQIVAAVEAGKLDPESLTRGQREFVAEQLKTERELTALDAKQAELEHQMAEKTLALQDEINQQLTVLNGALVDESWIAFLEAMPKIASRDGPDVTLRIVNTKDFTAEPESSLNGALK